MKKVCTIFILLVCSINNRVSAADKTAHSENNRRKSPLEIELNDMAAEIAKENKDRKAEAALKKIDDAHYRAEKEKKERAATATRALLTKQEEADPNWEPGNYIDREGQKRACERYKPNHNLLRRRAGRFISRNRGISWIKVKKSPPPKAFCTGLKK